jgi:hypothetical protein
MAPPEPPFELPPLPFPPVVVMLLAANDTNPVVEVIETAPPAEPALVPPALALVVEMAPPIVTFPLPDIVTEPPAPEVPPFEVPCAVIAAVVTVLDVEVILTVPALLPA